MIDVMLILLQETSKRNGNGSKIGLYYCVCGKIKESVIPLVKNGKIKSCGCLQKLMCSKNGKRKKTHGMTKSVEFRTWQKIKERCYNRNCKDYPDYGGRKIIICTRWLNSFENFYSDMGNRPSREHSIHRKDNDGNYCPENCEWATDKVQSRHKRNNVIITYNNKTQTLIDWSEELDIDYKVLHSRIKYLNWPIEKCFNKYIRNRENLIEYNNKKQNIKEWSKELGISYSWLRHRINSAVSIEEAFTKPLRSGKHENKKS